MVVGDDDQSIYRLRGADVRNILDFRKDYPDAHVVRLEQNYRSTPGDPRRGLQRHPQQPRARREEAVDGPRRAARRCAPTQAYNEVEEAEFVADEIERLRKTRSAATPTSRSSIAPTRSPARSRTCSPAAASRTGWSAASRFWERREVKDVVAYLRFCFNPSDALSFARIVSVPPRKIGNVTVDAPGRPRPRHGGGPARPARTRRACPGVPPRGHRAAAEVPHPARIAAGR